MKIRLRPVLFGLIALVGVVGLVQVVPTSQTPGDSSGTSVGAKTQNGQCDPMHPGVSLVLDFGVDSGREPVSKCAIGFNTQTELLNGWQLFSAAGIEVSGTTEYPVGFVCRVDGWPTAETQPCVSTPTYAQGHWAYFYAESNAQAKAHWVFSGAGAAQRKPSCGSAEGWLFVTGDGASGTEATQTLSVPPKVFSCTP